MAEQQIYYRRATRDDLIPIAEILLLAFPESIEHYVGKAVNPTVVTDAIAVCFDAEPDALIVAVVDGVVRGYIFAPANFPKVFRIAFLHGHILRGLWRWLSGQYGIGIRTVAIALKNWVAMWGESRSSKLSYDAHILSIAVHPDYQELGIGTQLMKLGLNYLKEAGAKTVRLEVRPDNSAAIHLYEKLGFQAKGHTKDSQGDWLIMLKEMLDHAET